MNAIYKFVMAQLAKSSAKKTGIATIQRGKGLNVESSVKQIEQTLKNMGVDVSKITSPKEVEKFLNISNASPKVFLSWLKVSINFGLRAVFSVLVTSFVIFGSTVPIIF